MAIIHNTTSLIKLSLWPITQHKDLVEDQECIWNTIRIKLSIPSRDFKMPPIKEIGKALDNPLRRRQGLLQRNNVAQFHLTEEDTAANDIVSDRRIRSEIYMAVLSPIIELLRQILFIAVVPQEQDSTIHHF